MNTTRQCSRCHSRTATRVLVSSRSTYFCDACEPTSLADYRRLVRLDDPIFAQPAQPAPVRDTRSERIAELERSLRQSREVEAFATKRAAMHEQQLADGARAFERLRQERETTVDETRRQLRAAEFSSAQWEAKATDYMRERDTALEKLGKAAGARDEAQSQLAQLRRQMHTAERPAAPAPVASSPAIADAPSRRRLTDLVASTVPLRGVRPLVVPPEMDLVYGVLPADNRSKIAQAIRDYLCGRRSPTRARGLDDTGRQLFTLGAGRFALTLALDDRDGFRIHELGAGAR